MVTKVAINNTTEHNPFYVMSAGERSMLAKLVTQLERLPRDFDNSDVNSWNTRCAEIYLIYRESATKSTFILDVARGFRKYGRISENQARAVIRNIHRDQNLIESFLDPQDEEFTIDMANAQTPTGRLLSNYNQPEEQKLPKVGVIRDGYFTVTLPNDGHVTLRILTKKRRNGEGTYRRMAFLMGPHNLSDYMNFGTIEGGRLQVFPDFQIGYERQKEAAKVLLTGGVKPEEAGKAFAQESKHCYVCNQLLTDPISIALGIGPICRGE